MPWCPICKNEYVEGMTVCADCGVELAESLAETEKRIPLIFGEMEKMERLKDFLLYNNLKSAHVTYDGAEGVYELFVKDEEKAKAQRAIQVFIQQENEKAQKEMMDELSEEQKEELLKRAEAEMEKKLAAAHTGPYQTSAKKAEENRSTGFMLITFGAIGLIAIVLLFFDVIALPFAMNKYMVCGIMGTLFLVFFVMGIMSVKSSKALEQKAEEEDNLTGELKRWCEENLTAEKVDANLFDEEEFSEEIRYFKRAEKMKQMITNQFLNLDEAFLEAFIDDYYPVIFETQDTLQ